MRDDKIAKKLARINEMERKTQEQLSKQHQRINERFERARAQVLKKYGQPSHSQKRIIDAALELLNEDGLNNLSLRKLASMLDMKAPALYWHFKSKEVLIDYMAEAILQTEFKELQPKTNEEAWQDWLVNTCQRLRHAMRAHRDGARVVAGAHLFPAVTLMKIFEASMQSLIEAGIDMQRANLIITTAIHFVFGNVIEEQASPSLDEIKNMDFNKLMGEYPLMAKSVQQSYQDALEGYDEFEDALRLIIGEPEKTAQKRT